jgi:(p)ppGpp synthase/HD superfamily hydrolase
MAYEKLRKAIDWAFELHKDQRRKVGGAPFISHLLAVTATVLKWRGDEEQAIAAVLHDAVEDQGVDLGEIRERFGGRVAHIVHMCSDTNVQPKPPWWERKLGHHARLHEAEHDVLLVVAADKLHNVRSLVEQYALNGRRIWDAFRGQREGTIWYYNAMAELLDARGLFKCSIPIHAELDRLHQFMVVNGER